ncbi:MAG: hypothetical protein K2H96_01910 [Muribaculaceae bacterium]|nr:hypothetical protein [Muribaculaceae bacterium]
MKKFFLILQVLVGTMLTFLLQSCGGEEMSHPWVPVDLEITGATIDDPDHFAYKVSIPSSGGEITVKGYGERGDQSYIGSIEEIAPNQHHFMVEWDNKPPYFGSDSWMTGEWWSITYTKETPPYEMVISIQPNHSDQERILELRYGSGAYVLSNLTITQKGK